MPDLPVARSLAELAGPTGAEAVVDVTVPRAHHQVNTEALLAGLQQWEAFRATRLIRGEPRGTAVSAKIQRPGAATITVDVGATIDGAPAWVRLRGADWYYAREPG